MEKDVDFALLSTGELVEAKNSILKTMNVTRSIFAIHKAAYVP